MRPAGRGLPVPALEQRNIVLTYNVDSTKQLVKLKFIFFSKMLTEVKSWTSKFNLTMFILNIQCFLVISYKYLIKFLSVIDAGRSGIKTSPEIRNVQSCRVNIVELLVVITSFWIWWYRIFRNRTSLNHHSHK